MARYLITGGAGFIGVNAADHYAKQGDSVVVLDNFSRRGTKENRDWLCRQHPGVRAVQADIRSDVRTIEAEAARCDVILHMAGQVAVTTSVADPRTDFEINALGTLNLLEAARRAPKPPVVIYSSTNKVYGGMEGVQVVEDGNHYRYRDLPSGISEAQPLDFHSPYGCSKGAADQYVRDYARIYGLRTVVLRQSCIYGTHQFGIEDQGWVAWFTTRALLDLPVTIYGNGKQVRDVLYIDDLVAAFDGAVQQIDRTAGQVYNIGGGPGFTLSLLELIEVLEKIAGRKMSHSSAEWRPGDQRVYVSDVSKAERDFGWRPTISPQQGVKRLYDWMAQHADTLRHIYQS